ncbi:DUF4365 domain-containing protein [Pseudolactococcus carnosus]|uniref:DUF4365 domain-containing protein n=1 Tax=Pseudolactococcus carnosus TaxID=2749961 RepID=A0ABT0ARP2_9LACT|nr:DUF4365 domain-containing protein [Lactococcus carnosus]MCJ1989364.1 DUF4365 domain-containing protein [Lactococcus carnosus]
MNANDIEILAVSKLKRVLTINEYLSPVINEGDKEPSWDGHIYLYQKKGKKKKDIKGRVSIQVKGVEENSTIISDIKYTVSVVDLRNYLKDGGVIYFVVYVDRQGNDKIYYCTMEPLIIKKFLNELKKSSQKNKTISFKALPEDDDKIRDIFFNFQLNSQKQISFIGYEPLSFNNLIDKLKPENLEISIQGYGMKDISDFAEFKKYNQAFMYAKISDLNILVPMDVILSEIFEYKEVDITVGVSGKVYYEKVISEYHSKDKVILRLSNWLAIIFNPLKKQFNAQLSSGSFFRSAAHDMSFFLSAIKEQNFELNGIAINLVDWSREISQADYEHKVEMLELFDETVKLMDMLGVKEDIDMITLSDLEKNNLEMLRISLIDQKLMTGFPEKINILKIVEIGRYKFACIFQEVDKERGTYRIFDIFDTPFNILTEDVNGDGYHYSILMLLDSKCLSEITNIKYDKMLISFQELPFNEYVLDHTNRFALTLINASDIIADSDETRKNELLKTALTFLEWVDEKDIHSMMEDMLFINKIQIQKRMRKLKAQELKELLLITELDEISTGIRFSAYTLLEDKVGADLQFKLFSEENREDLKGYPIWNLYNTLE